MRPPEPEFLQAYSPEIWQCAGCSTEFHPMLKTQPGWMRLTLVGGVLSIFAVAALAPNEPPWVYAKVAWIALLVGAAIAGPFIEKATLRNRRTVARHHLYDVKYGQILAMCTECGSTEVAPRR
jgi:hypothetical protein